MFRGHSNRCLRCSTAESMCENSRYSVLSKFHLLLLSYVLFACLVHQSSAGSPCAYSKQKGLQTADCSHKDFKDVPKNLRPETEVLDLSWNFIKELHNDSFVCCKNLKLLYLQTNRIHSIDSHAFAPLTSLSVLDLSENILNVLPVNLPHSLVKLYLDLNPTLFSGRPVLPISRITSLETLHLSSNELHEFPQFNGTVPNLVKLNITDNFFTHISVDDLAALCQLKYLYVKPNSLYAPSPAGQPVEKQQFCACLELERWVIEHGIELSSFKCRKDKFTNLDCDLERRNSTEEIYRQCMAEVESRKLPYKLMVGGCLFAVIIAAIVFFFLRRRRQTKDKIDGISNHKSRTSSGLMHADNKTMEEKCTNPAFDNYRIQHIKPPHWETEV